MEKTDTFFLIHNYNTVPENLIEYTDNYLIVDASDKPEVVHEIEQKGLNSIHVENTGHNITTYFSYFADHHDDLPEVMCICKGNMIGRHCSKEYFDKVYRNTWFTYLYEDRTMWQRYSKPSSEMLENNHGKDPNADCIASLVSESQYIEINSSWYEQSPNHPHRFFTDYDELLRFVYKDPVIPKYILFSPGACYIVRREQITRHSPEFYRNLNSIMNYGMNPSFPSEAHMVERMLPTIFEGSYEENPWMNDTRMFADKLEERKKIVTADDEWNSLHLKRIRMMLGQGPKYQ